MPVAFATGRALSMNVDVPIFLRAIATAMETRSTCWANAGAPAPPMRILTAFATMWIRALVNTTNAAFATGAERSLDMTAAVCACSTSTLMASVTNLEWRAAPTKKRATTQRMPQTTMAHARTLQQVMPATGIACLMKTTTVFAIKTKPQAARTNRPAIMIVLQRKRVTATMLHRAKIAMARASTMPMKMAFAMKTKRRCRRQLTAPWKRFCPLLSTAITAVTAPFGWRKPASVCRSTPALAIWTTTETGERRICCSSFRFMAKLAFEQRMLSFSALKNHGIEDGVACLVWLFSWAVQSVQTWLLRNLLNGPGHQPTLPAWSWAKLPSMTCRHPHPIGSVHLMRWAIALALRR